MHVVDTSPKVDGFYFAKYYAKRVLELVITQCYSASVLVSYRTFYVCTYITISLST